MTAWIPLACWTVFVALHVLLSGRVWFWTIAELIPPVAFVLVPPAAGAVVLLVSGPRGEWAVVLVLVLLVVGARWSGITIPRPGGAGPGDLLVVFVWNTEHWDQGLDQASFLGFVAAQDADVYLLQEYIFWVDGREVPADGVAELAAKLPDHEVFVDGELVTAARKRLVPRRQDGVGGTALRVDVTVAGKATAFYNIHLPIQLDPDRSPLRREFYHTMRRRTRRQWQAFCDVEELLRHAPPSFVFGGDFNSSPAMRAMGRLRADRIDVMRSAGRLYPATWPAHRHPLWRIDWILTSRQVATDWARLVDPEGRSDHTGQLCALRP